MFKDLRERAQLNLDRTLAVKNIVDILVGSEREWDIVNTNNGESYPIDFGLILKLQLTHYVWYTYNSNSCIGFEEIVLYVLRYFSNTLANVGLDLNVVPEGFQVS